MKNSRSHRYFSRPAENKTTTADTTSVQNSPSNPKSATERAGEPDDNGVIIMDMPEVKDIPGQEHIIPPHFREMMDVTISSADEEGEGILDDLNKEDDDDADGIDNNVSSLERSILAKADRPVTEEQIDRAKLSLDKTDGDDLLNEESDPSDLGEGLDIPGADLDDDDEATGEENEENNSYSRPD